MKIAEVNFAAHVGLRPTNAALPHMCNLHASNGFNPICALFRYKVVCVPFRCHSCNSFLFHMLVEDRLVQQSCILQSKIALAFNRRTYRSEAPMGNVDLRSTNQTYRFDIYDFLYVGLRPTHAQLCWVYIPAQLTCKWLKN